MKAYHLALEHPFAAVTKADGSFEIQDLSAGEHEFRIWHESAPAPGFLNRKFKVTVKPGETETVDISFDASQFNL